MTMQHFVVSRELKVIQSCPVTAARALQTLHRPTHRNKQTNKQTHTHTHRNTQAILWWSWPVQMASGPLYIIQACLHGVSGGLLRCQDYFAHSQKQWRNCGPLCMLPAKCCFQNQLREGSCFCVFIYCQHLALFVSLFFSLYFTLFVLLFLSSMVTS